MFCGHPSLRFGDAVHFIQLWGSNPQNLVIFTGIFSAMRREIIYCKRAILSLSSSKILTPHPPLRLASVSSPPKKGGGYTLAGRRGGWGVNILEDERDRIALLQ
jgi:hypothetical protein